jgi:hypothetical protein
MTRFDIVHLGLFVACLCLAWHTSQLSRRLEAVEGEVRHLRDVLLRWVPAEQLYPRETRAVVPGIARLTVVSPDRHKHGGLRP